MIEYIEHNVSHIKKHSLNKWLSSLISNEDCEIIDITEKMDGMNVTWKLKEKEDESNNNERD